MHIGTAFFYGSIEVKKSDKKYSELYFALFRAAERTKAKVLTNTMLV